MFCVLLGFSSAENIVNSTCRDLQFRLLSFGFLIQYKNLVDKNSIYKKGHSFTNIIATTSGLSDPPTSTRRDCKSRPVGIVP